MDYEIVWGFVECLVVIGFSSIVAFGCGLGEYLVKKLIERKKKRTSGSFAELYEDNKHD